MQSHLRLRHIITVLLLAIGLLSLAACTSSEEGEPIVIGQTVTLRSEVLEEERTLKVHLPQGYESATGHYPVLILLDGPRHFHHVTGVTEFLAANFKALPVIVVGVANTNRTRDLTPPTETPEDSTFAGNGGADHFLEFMEMELLPYIDANYRTTPYRILVGHSFGGLFAFHALVTRPDLFEAYVAVDPSLWWNNGAPLEDFKAYLKAHPDLGKTLFVSDAPGDDDLAEKYDKPWQRVNLMHTKFLAEYGTYIAEHAPSGLRWGFKQYPLEEHSSVVHQSVYDGLELVFADMDLLLPELFLLTRDEGLAALDAYYAGLAARFGTSPFAPEGAVNEMGGRLLYFTRVKQAVALFEANIQRFPQSANAYDSLGDSYKAAGELEKAIESYRQAVALGKKSRHPALSSFKANLAQAEEELKKKPGGS